MAKKKELTDPEINFLKSILDKHLHIDSQLDMKANMILAIIGVGAVFSLSQLLNLQTSLTSFKFLGWLTIVTSSVISLIIILLGVFPKYLMKEKNIFYYGSFIRDLSEEDYIKKLDEIISDKNKILKAFARELYTLSFNVLKPGYQRLRIALSIFLIGIILGSILIIISSFGNFI